MSEKQYKVGDKVVYRDYDKGFQSSAVVIDVGTAAVLGIGDKNLHVGGYVILGPATVEPIPSK